MSEQVNITSKGIQKVLKTYSERQAVAEYIWNGFDAHASLVKIDYSYNELGYIDKLTIADNGYGIDFTKLKQKFDPFYESEKAIQITVPKHTSKMHGRNGVGRLTFFTFANSATWTTTYQSASGYQSGSIFIETGGLDAYQHDFTQAPSPEGITGTEVSFMNLRISKAELELSIIPFLVNEFCWFIELNRHKDYSIEVNGVPLDFSTNVKTMEEFTLVHDESQVHFKIKYVHWNESLHRELSKYYFLAGGEEIYKDFTTLNKKSDDYFHSIYIESDFFRAFDFNNEENVGQVAMFGAAKSSREYRFLMNHLNEYLKNKRKPFLKEHAAKLVLSYEEEGIFSGTVPEGMAKESSPDIRTMVKALYEIEPKLFSGLNIFQKKAIVGFLEILIQSDDREKAVSMINQLVGMEEEDKLVLTALF